MSFSLPKTGYRPYHVLLVRADRNDTSTLPGPLGAGLIAHTTTNDPGFDIDALPNIAVPDVIVLDFPAGRPIDFAFYSHVHRRSRGRPIVVLGPRHDTDCILTLELGADDYLAKPCATPELAARIRAILRRRDGEKAALRIRGLLAGRDFDTARRSLISMDGRETRLTIVEFELLRYLIETPHRLHSRDQLAVMLYHRQDRHYELRSIDVFINGLRQKLMDVAPYRLIRTERGQGYVFTPAAAE